QANGGAHPFGVGGDCLFGLVEDVEDGAVLYRVEDPVPVAAILDKAAPAEVGKVVGDSRLLAIEKAADLLHRVLPVLEGMEDGQADRIGEATEELRGQIEALQRLGQRVAVFRHGELDHLGPPAADY